MYRSPPGHGPTLPLRSGPASGLPCSLLALSGPLTWSASHHLLQWVHSPSQRTTNTRRAEKSLSTFSDLRHAGINAPTNKSILMSDPQAHFRNQPTYFSVIVVSVQRLLHVAHRVRLREPEKTPGTFSTSPILCSLRVNILDRLTPMVVDPHSFERTPG